MKQHFPYIIFIIAAIVSTAVISRDFRVSQIPNGSKFSCSNCHVNTGGGGVRNKFGQTVEEGFLSINGSVQWNAQLAAIDSDGDGFSNGTELQDPNGSWSTGQPAPGNFSLVTNPGDPNSKPNPTSVAEASIPNSYKLFNNYPNPFNPSTRIAFQIPQAEFVELKIFNINGELIKTISAEQIPAGYYEKIWDGKNERGEVVPSGVYIYRLSAGNFERSARMILMK